MITTGKQRQFKKKTIFSFLATLYVPPCQKKNAAAKKNRNDKGILIMIISSVYLFFFNWNRSFRVVIKWSISYPTLSSQTRITLIRTRCVLGWFSSLTVEYEYFLIQANNTLKNVRNGKQSSLLMKLLNKFYY